MERLNPQHLHEIVVAWHEEKGVIVVCLREPLRDVVKQKRIEYPLDRTNEVSQSLEAVIGSKALVFCQAVLGNNRTTVASILVAPHHLEVTLAPLALVEDVYDDVVRYISPCLQIGKDQIYDMRRREAATKERMELLDSIRRIKNYDLCGWSPQWGRVFLFKAKTTIYGDVIMGPAWRLYGYRWIKGATIEGGKMLSQDISRGRIRYYASGIEKGRIEAEQADVLEEYESMLAQKESLISELEAYINAY